MALRGWRAHRHRAFECRARRVSTRVQCKEIDGLVGRIVTKTQTRPQRTEGKPVGYLYEACEKPVASNGNTGRISMANGKRL
jgi:hypothetical protein